MTNEQSNYDELQEYVTNAGGSAFGVADITDYKKKCHIEPEDLIEDLNYGICIGVRLSDRIVDGIKDQPTAMYSFHYRRINILLDEISVKVTNFIQGKGYDALPIHASQIANWYMQVGHVSHRDVGKLAGVGYIGRNKLLVHPEFGSRVRYITILTNIPLSTGEPLDMDCGECRACVMACPAQAIKESSNDFDQDACKELLKKFSKKAYIGQSICGVCVAACQGRRKKQE